MGTRTIPDTEWDLHKSSIISLYFSKPLDDVRANMAEEHGFDARLALMTLSQLWLRTRSVELSIYGN
jgi:hypothetical protein